MGNWPKDPYDTSGMRSGGPPPDDPQPTPHAKGGPPRPDGIPLPGGDVGKGRGLDERGDPFGTRLPGGGVVRPTKPRAAVAAAAYPSPSPVQRVRLLDGFYQSIPWDRVEYYTRNFVIDYPNALGRSDIARFQVPTSQMLMLTSIIFRVYGRPYYSPVTPTITGTDSVYCNDTLLIDTTLAAARSYFIMKIGGAAPFDQQTVAGATLATQAVADGWALLNQNIIPTDITPFVVARPRQLIEVWGVNMATASLPSAYSYLYLGVDFRGFWLPENVWNALTTEHRG